MKLSVKIFELLIIILYQHRSFLLIQVCPGWSQWESWSFCDAVCGGGIRTRTRVCSGDESYCLGSGIIEESCNRQV